jgi:Fe-S-cluster containining protein
MKVELLAPEALAIAEVLRHAAADAGSDSELEADLTARADTMRALSLAERWQQQLPCAFLDLESERCTIHPVRPLACRQHHSVDASECERAAKDVSGEQRTRSRLLLDAIWAAARAAVRYACAEAGLDDRGFELTNAVALALREPTARERWARGERLFDAATIPSDAEDQRFVARHSRASDALISRDNLVRKPSQAERNKQKRDRKQRKPPK